MNSTTQARISSTATRHSQLIWIAVILIIISGIYLQYRSSTIGYVSKIITVIEPGITANEPNDKLKKLSIIEQPTEAFLYTAISNLLFGLAGSIVISIFIIKRLEDKLAEERAEHLASLNQAVNENVFDTLFKTTVPPEIYSVIKSGIIRNDILRRDLDWNLSFSETPQKTIELLQIIQYKMINLSNEAISHTMPFRHDAASGISSLLELSVKKNGATLFSFDSKTKKSHEAIKIQSKDDGSSEIQVTCAIEKGGELDFTAVFRTLYETVPINDANFMKYPVINAKLTASFPKEYAFSIFDQMSSPLVSTFSNDHTTVYKAEGGILPGQGYAYILKRKPPEMNQTATNSAQSKTQT